MFECFRYNLYFYPVLLEVFLYLVFRSTKISEIFDMINTWVTLYCLIFLKYIY